MQGESDSHLASNFGIRRVHPQSFVDNSVEVRETGGEIFISRVILRIRRKLVSKLLLNMWMTSQLDQTPL
jgi:hypothetical protein